MYSTWQWKGKYGQWSCMSRWLIWQTGISGYFWPFLAINLLKTRKCDCKRNGINFSPVFVRSRKPSAKGEPYLVQKFKARNLESWYFHLSSGMLMYLLRHRQVAKVTQTNHPEKVCSCKPSTFDSNRHHPQPPVRPVKIWPLQYCLPAHKKI